MGASRPVLGPRSEVVHILDAFRNGELFTKKVSSVNVVISGFYLS